VITPKEKPQVKPVEIKKEPPIVFEEVVVKNAFPLQSPNPKIPINTTHWSAHVDRYSVPTVKLVQRNNRIFFKNPEGNPHTGRGVHDAQYGHWFIGDYIDGEMVYGTYVHSDTGSTYTGPFVNRKPQGKGKYIWNMPSGKKDIYEGDFYDGEYNGYGIFLSEQGWRYEGQFSNGKRTGRGIIIYANGERAEGIFKEGKLTNIY